MRFAGVVFDMDGLMFDTERLAIEGWLYAAREIGLTITEAQIIETIGFNATKTRDHYTELFGSDFDYDGISRTAQAHVHSLVEAEGLPMKPGLVELLDFLRAEGYPIGLATSTRTERALDNLERTGVRSYFDITVCGDMVARSKPEPDIYLEACRRLGVAPEEALALEDSPAGIRAATSAGMRAVMVPDIIKPDEKIKALLWQQCETLHDVIGLLR